MATKKKKTKESELEKEYKRIFDYLRFQNIPTDKSLEQPSHHKKVKTYVTYGVGEEPL